MQKMNIYMTTKTKEANVFITKGDEEGQKVLGLEKHFYFPSQRSRGFGNFDDIAYFQYM